VTVATGPGAACGLFVSDAALGAAIATDNCAGAATVARSGVPAGNFFPVGMTAVTYTATDAAGNTTTATQTVTVLDTSPPVLTAPANVTVATGPGAACGLFVSDAALGAATATDNCAGSAAITRSGVPAGNFFPVGSTVVTYTATDAAGNTTTATQTVTVLDTSPPVLTAPANITVATGPGAACGLIVSDAALGAATATDNCAGSAAITRRGVPAGNFFPVGTTTITYTATDAAGNTTTATQTVTVLDTSPPVLTAPANVTVATGPGAACGLFVSDAALGAATATDNCAGSAAITRSGVPAGNFFPVGSTVVTYTATDAAGNTTTATQTVTVLDTSPPVLTVPANVSVATGPGAACGLVVSDAALGAAVATDNCAGSATIARSGVPAGNIFPVGATAVTYTATDAAGNTTTATQTVTVLDTSPPVLTAPGNVTVATGPGAACGLFVSDAALGAAIATDNCAGAATVARSGVPAGNFFPVGMTAVTYTATDAAG